MGFLSWIGFNKPRDAPMLPDIQDNVRDSGNLFVFGMTHSGERVDERTAMQIVTVYACVRLLSNTIAGLPLHLYRYTGDGEDKERATDHPLYKILYRQPNPEMSSFSFWEALMCHLLLWGNAYAQIVRDGKNEILGLYPLLPENMEIDRDPKSGDLFYTYHAYTDEKPGEHDKDIIFQRDEILHIPGLGFNGLVGFSPIAMMKNALGAAMAVERYGSAFFKNGAQPAGVLEHPGVLKNPEKIRENWTRVYGGSRNAHRIAVLEEGMQYKPISLPPEDSQFLSTREFDVEEICRMFQVPPHLVQDLKRSTFNNIEHQGIAFVQYSLMPWIIRIEKGIIKDLLLEEEQDVYFPKFNVDGLMRGDYQSRMNAYAIGVGNGFMSPNDVRRLENMDLIPHDLGGDDYYLNPEPFVLGKFNTQNIMEIINDGDEIGFTLQIEALADVRSPTLYNADTDEYLQITGDILAGDIITVTTKTGHKTVTLDRGGVKTNIINRLVSGSTWLTLREGKNRFYLRGTGLQNLKVTIVHTNAYLGV